MLDCRGHLFYYVVAMWLLLSAAVAADTGNWSLVTEQQQVRSEGLARTVWHVLHELNCTGALLKRPTPSDDTFRLHVIGAEDSPEGGSNFSILARLLRSNGWRTLNVHLVGYSWQGKCSHSNPLEGLIIECERGAYDHVYRKFAHPPNLAVLLEPGLYNQAGVWYDSLTLLLNLTVPLLLTTPSFAEMAHGQWFFEAARAWTDPPMQRCAAPASSQMMLNADMPNFYQRFESLQRLETRQGDSPTFHAFMTLSAMDTLGASLLAGPIWNPFGFPAEAIAIHDVDPSTYFSGTLFVMQGMRPPRFTRDRFQSYMVFRTGLIWALEERFVDENGFAWLQELFEQEALFEIPLLKDVNAHEFWEVSGGPDVLVDYAARHQWDVGVVSTWLKERIRRYSPDHSHLADEL